MDNPFTAEIARRLAALTLPAEVRRAGRMKRRSSRC